MKEYSNKDVASIVGIAGPTVRKYAQLLEKSGYTFTRNELGHRVFLGDDLPILRGMKERSDQGTAPLERIAEEVVIRIRRYKEEEKEDILPSENPISDSATTMPETLPNQHIGQLNELYALIKHFEERLNMMDDMARELKEVKEENRMLRGVMNQRFDETMRIMMETRKMLAAAEEEKGKPWWKRLLK